MDPATGGMRVIVMRAPASRDGVERPVNQKRAGPEPLVAVPGQLMCVLGGVLLSRTLAGAVPSALSGLASGFGMDTGRFPVAVTTETTTWAVLDRHLWCGYSVIGPPADPHPRVLARGACVGGWVGCGPYSGRSRLPYHSPHGTPTHTKCVACGWGCCCLCWPISTSQLIGPLPVFHFWPINPVVCWGPTRTPKVSCGDLILKMVSRLDAFSGYPSRT